MLDIAHRINRIHHELIHVGLGSLIRGVNIWVRDEAYQVPGIFILEGEIFLSHMDKLLMV